MSIEMKNYKIWDRIIMMFLTSFSFKAASRYIYWRTFHTALNLKNPRTFNEMLMSLKLGRYAENSLVAQCADKYRVREYVQRQGCQEILVPLLGVWEQPSEIPFEKLPDRFVLKCNHGCGYNVICTQKEKLNISDTRKLLKKWMHEDFWRRFGECNYKNIKKKIICEAYIGTDILSVPIDYKFYCFNGSAKYVMVCQNRAEGKPKFYFFNRNWELERINQDGISAAPGFCLKKPELLDQMFLYADRLAAPFPFVRVDLYENGAKIFFGELTFTPSAALDTARLPEADRLFCGLLKSS